MSERPGGHVAGSGTEPPEAPRQRSRGVIVVALGLAQTLAWGSSYYLPAILADPIGASLGISRAWVFAAFSFALLVAAAAGPMVGRTIDQYGGRWVLILSNLVLAGGLVALAAAHGPASLFAAWAVLGVGMALGLYDASFATLTTLYGHMARGPITAITLLGGFASTVSWPVSSFLDNALDWRSTVLVWAALNLCVGLPLNWLVPPLSAPAAPRSRGSAAAIGWKPRREMSLLAFVFAAAWFVTGAMASQLPTLLERSGVAPVAAIAAAALVGPAQVGARVGEFIGLRNMHPLYSARIAALLHPLGSAVFALLGPPAAAAFALFYGAGNGLLTIARGTVPLAVFGPRGYGERTGLIGAPARAAQALAPVTFGVLLDTMGPSAAIFASAALCLAAFAALLCLPASRPLKRPDLRVRQRADYRRASMNSRPASHF